MAVIPLASEIDYQFDFLIRHMGTDGYAEAIKRDNFKKEELYNHVKYCVDNHLDWRTGEAISEKASDNRDAVYMQSAVTNGHWCGGKRPQCGASAVGLS